MQQLQPHMPVRESNRRISVEDMQFVLNRMSDNGCLPTNRKVSMIKAIREMTGLGLKEAKELSDSYM